MLDGAQAWGDRFVAVLGAPRTAGWAGVAQLVGPELPATLAAVGAARGTDADDVAAALLFEQYALRLAAPVVAACYHRDAVLDAALPLVSAELVDGTVRRLAFAAAPRPTAGPDPDAMLAGLVDGNLEPVADALHRHTRIGTRVLRGIMANAVVSALLHLSWPEEDRARHVGDARALLRRAGWTGLVNVEAVQLGGRAWMYTDRNTCCQAFRTAVNRARAQRYCRTCPVVPRATTAAEFAEATAAYAARNG